MKPKPYLSVTMVWLIKLCLVYLKILKHTYIPGLLANWANEIKDTKLIWFDMPRGKALNKQKMSELESTIDVVVNCSSTVAVVCTCPYLKDNFNFPAFKAATLQSLEGLRSFLKP